MNYKTFKEYSKWLSQISAVISLIIVVFLQSKRVFINDSVPGTLVLIAMIIAVFTFIFSVIALPRWQSFVTLAVFIYVTYSLLFTPLYGIH